MMACSKIDLVTRKRDWFAGVDSTVEQRLTHPAKLPRQPRSKQDLKRALQELKRMRQGASRGRTHSKAT